MRSYTHVDLARNQLRAGDILLEKSGGGERQPVGKAVLVDRPDGPAVGSNFVARLRAAPGVDPTFLVFLLESLYATRMNVRHIKQSTGIQNLDASSFLDERVYLPSIREQARIVSFLEEETERIDGLIKKKQSVIGLLGEEERSFSAGLLWPDVLPSTWTTMPLMRLTDPNRPIMYGIVLPGPNVADGVPLVKGGDVTNGRLSIGYLNKTTPEIEAPYSRARLRGGDVLLTIRGRYGDAALVPNELTGANITQDVARIAPRPDVSPGWLLHVIQSEPITQSIVNQAGGAAVRGVNIRDVKRYVVPVPPLEEQKRLASVIDERTEDVSQAVAAVEAALDRLREYRRALITAAVTGQIDLGDAA